MRVRRTIWLLLVALLLAGGYGWRLLTKQSAPAPAATVLTAQKAHALPLQTQASARSPLFNLLSPAALESHSNTVAAARAERFRHRITNTAKTIGQLMRSDSAILLENALIDTASAAPLAVPAALRAAADPGSYIVQSRGPVDAAFRAQLAAAGATIVSYIPNNAYLVTAAGDLRQMLSGPKIQAVCAYEPQFKLKSDLLKLVLEKSASPQSLALNVLLFPGQREAVAGELEKLGAEILSEERSPFGPVLTVRAASDTLAAVARMRGVHEVESFQPRVPANDLSRVKMGVSSNTLAATPNYLGLTGSNILVTVCDTGVSTNNPDLAGRVLYDNAANGRDTSGHGTHVAGIIASSGLNSLTIGTNASRSVAGASFRGKAPGARILSLAKTPITYLQETAVRSNSFINNNSWNSGSGYTLAAASYDAATRDALPETPGSQPALYVFSVGNDAHAENDGTGGNSDSILAPATAKNVISVGALEQPRNITNLVQASYGSTNRSAVFLAGSDSDNEVAAYSKRGNVGVGTEGDTGRFKPDVVAPGSWVVSTRPPGTEWDEAAYYNPTNYHPNTFLNWLVRSNELNIHQVFIPNNAVQINIAVTQPLPIYVSQNGAPTNSTPDGYGTFTMNFPPGMVDAQFSFGVGNTNSQAVTYDVTATIVTTNDNGNTYSVLSNKLNGPLAPNYRYESGTSMAAAAVSGTLALMQEFFEQRLHITNSPALMKALLINGARSAAGIYDFQVRNLVNHQGWGLVNLTNSLPATLTANSGGPAPLVMVDQSPAAALATGESHTRNITLSAAARNKPLRITLVWTDPPGDPSASLKLVNDLDLVVTNLVNGDVFFGNDILVNNNFNLPWDTNNLADVDIVNNVENVYIGTLGESLGASYSITVRGSRVNVNAVTAHTNNVVQDYALVISSGNGGDAAAITLANPAPTISISNAPLVTTVADNFGTNAGSKATGAILMHQRVGANTPLLGTNTIVRTGATNQLITVGMTNQWHFYIFVNTNLFDNVAFATFQPPELSVPRIGVRSTANATRPQADVDIYVSTNPALTNLNPAVLLAADKSLSRGGTEVITFTNGGGQTYYIGVKAEDQMAAEYAFLSIASEAPFDQNENGNLILTGLPGSALIPDGTPADPGTVLVFGIATKPITVRRVVVTNVITHELMGDLVGSLTHDDQYAVLNNHTGNGGPATQAFIYDDSGEGGLNPPSGYTVKHTDGPGTLMNFVGKEGIGLWLLTMLDNSPGDTGRVDNLTIRLEPQLDTNSVTVTIEPGGFYTAFVDVPPTATNLTVSVSGNTQPVQLLLRRDAPPTLTDFDAQTTVNPPGGQLTLTRTGIPPLLTGRYYITVYNPPQNTAQTVTITWTVGLDLNGVFPINYASGGSTPLLDDAVINSTITVGASNTNHIVSVDVGVRIDHPRVSDLALTLISPDGTRVLLSENRGAWDTNGFGATVITTNTVNVSANGNAAPNTNYINTGMTSGTFPITYNFYTARDQMTVYYGTNLVPSNLILDTGFTNNPSLGPGAQNTSPQTIIVSFPPPGAIGALSTYLTIIINQYGNTNAQTEWTYTAGGVLTNYNYFIFTEDETLTTTPIKYYIPPFRGTPGSEIFYSSFEGAGTAGFTNPAAVDGWAVAANSVTGSTNTAYYGTNSLALQTGTISRPVPLTAGHQYTLSYAWQNAGISNLIQNGSFELGTNSWDGTAVAVYVTNANGYLLPSDATNFAVIGSGDIAGSSLAQTFPIAPGSYQLTFDHSGWGVPGTASTLAAIITTPLDGVIVSNNFDMAITDTNPIVYQTAPITFTIPAGNTNATLTFLDVSTNGVANDIVVDHVLLNPVSPPAFSVTLPGALTNTVTATNTAWATSSQTFIAASTSTATLQFQSLQSGVLLDAISLVDLGTLAYALPETSLDVLKGQSVAGTWTLEVWDSRTGATNLASLLSWNLSFIFENTAPSTVYSIGTNPPSFLNTNLNGSIITTNEMTALSINNTATDPDPGTILSYTLINPPAGVSITSGGVILWTPTETQGPVTNTITTVVTDNGVPSQSVTNTFTIIVSEANTAPYFTAGTPADQTLTALQTLTVPDPAQDSDIPTNTLAYALLVAPAGATINTNTGVITWTPATNQLSGSNVFTTVVTDNGLPPLSATNSFTVTVTTNAPGFTLLQYNVKGNGALDWSTNAAQVQAIARELTYLNPDIIAFNEIPVAFTNEMTNWGSTFLAGYTIVISPGNDGFICSAVASRYPITRSASWLDGADLNPFGYTNSNFTRDLFEAQINLPGFGKPLHVFTTHLKSSLTGYTDAAAKRAAETAAITNFFATNFFVFYTNDFYTLSGDLNESGTNTAAIQQLLSPPMGLFLTSPVNPITGSINTDPSTAPSSRIDYIMPCGPLFSNIASSQVFRSEVLSPMPPGLTTNDSTTASDHLAVLMAFNNPDGTNNTAPVFTATPSTTTVLALAALVLTNAATDAQAPPQTLAYTVTVTNLLYGGLVTNNPATINTNTGVITWTPSVAQSPTTNLITTVVTDSGVPSLSATNSFTVIVNPPPPFNITSVIVGTNSITLGWIAPSYEQFMMQWASNLAQPTFWMDFTNIITPTPSGSTNFLFIDDGTQTGGFLDPQRFYRLRLLP